MIPKGGVRVFLPTDSSDPIEYVEMDVFDKETGRCLARISIQKSKIDDLPGRYPMVGELGWIFVFPEYHELRPV